MKSGKLTIHDDLEPLLTPVTELTGYHRNPRKGDVEVIIESMKVNGMYRPVYARRATGEVLAGNHTLAAAKVLGATEIPVVWLDVNETQAKKIVLADNRTADAGTYDNPVLVEILTELAEQDSIAGTGYDAEALAQLEALAEIPEAITDDFGSWPTLSFQVHPKVRTAFMEATSEAGSEGERFLLLLERAGVRW